MSKIKVHIDNDGIMCVEYPLHAVVAINNIREEYKKRLAITNKKTPLLVKLHGLASFSEDAQKFLCSPEHCAITSAAAIVVDSEAGYFEHSKILIDFFKGVRKPPFNFKVFENEDAALIWLKTYL